VSGVAITGIGIVSPFGVGTGAFWSGLCAGACPLVPGADGVPTGAAPALDARAFVRTSGGRRIDHASLLALAAARLALEDAKLPEGAVSPSRTGLALGSALGNVRETVSFMDRVYERGAGNPLVFPNMVMNAALAYVSIELGVTGPTVMTCDLEVSGESAIAWGVRTILDGAADVCLAGATDELADAIIPPVLREARVVTRSVARPLDPGSDGHAIGEGAAVFVLESVERARRRGARVVARIEPHPGFGVPSPLHGYPPDADGLTRRLAPLLADADLVVACASGLPSLDEVEARMLARTVGRRTPITAPRGALGHFGGAGALAVAVAALALHHARVPPTAGCRLPAREALDVVVGEPRSHAAATAVVTGLGRGGLCRPLKLVRETAA
jgi:3-oxoacyl-[acyl-carrier-protein] synthase II